MLTGVFLQLCCGITRMAAHDSLPITIHVSVRIIATNVVLTWR